MSKHVFKISSHQNKVIVPIKWIEFWELAKQVECPFFKKLVTKSNIVK